MARRDCLVEALALLQKAAHGELPPSLDIGELYIAELKSRRKRINSWISILHAMARRQVPYASRRRPCRRYRSLRSA
jgi:hypothetical protein